MEFIIMLSTMIVFSILFLGVMGYYNKSQLSEKNTDAIINLLDYLENEVVLASKMKEGYKQVFDIPEKINNKDYVIITEATAITIKYEGKSHTTIIPEITGTIQIPTNTIKKIGEEVYIN